MKINHISKTLRSLFEELEHPTLVTPSGYLDSKRANELDETLNYLLVNNKNLQILHYNRKTYKYDTEPIYMYFINVSHALKEAFIYGFDIQNHILRNFFVRNQALEKLLIKNNNNNIYRSTELYFVELMSDWLI